MARKERMRNRSIVITRPAICGYVRIDGKVHYLGKYNSESSLNKYDRLVGLWRLNGRKLPADALPHHGKVVEYVQTVQTVPTFTTAATFPTPMPNSTQVAGITITELIDLYLEDMEREYQSQDLWRP